MHLFDLPVCCLHQGRTSRFQHHVLRIHLQHPFKAGRSTGIRSLIMLTEHLDILCGEVMQWAFLQIPCPTPIIIKNRNKAKLEFMQNLNFPDSHEPASQSNITTKIQVREAHGKKLSGNIIDSILRHFDQLSAGGQKVVFMNCESSVLTKALQKRMGPAVICGASSVWLLHDILAKLRARSFAGMSDGQHKRAVAVCDLMVGMLRGFSLIALPTNVMDYQLETPVTLTIRSAIDLVANTILLCLKNNDLEESLRLDRSLRFVFDLLRNLPRQDLFSPARSRGLLGSQVHMWAACLLRVVTTNQARDAAEVLHMLLVVRQYATDTRLLERVDHDIAFVKDYARNHKVSSWYGRPALCGKS